MQPSLWKVNFDFQAPFREDLFFVFVKTPGHGFENISQSRLKDHSRVGVLTTESDGEFDWKDDEYEEREFESHRPEKFLRRASAPGSPIFAEK